MKYLKHFESLYNEINPDAQKITKMFLDFSDEFDSRKEKILNELQEEFDSEQAKTLAKLTEINNTYMQTIQECLVDVEEFYKNGIQAKVAITDSFGTRAYYVCKTSDYQRFKTLQQKLNDVIGQDAYNMEYKIGPAPVRHENNPIRYATPEFVTGSDNIKTIEQLEQLLEDMEEDRMTVRFVFKPINKSTIQ